MAIQIGDSRLVLCYVTYRVFTCRLARLVVLYMSACVDVFDIRRRNRAPFHVILLRLLHVQLLLTAASELKSNLARDARDVARVHRHTRARVQSDP